MPDDPRAATRGPHDWNEALAALPLEQPPGDGWPRLQAGLPATRSMRQPSWARRARSWTAVAAVVVVAIGSAGLLRRHAGGGGVDATRISVEARARGNDVSPSMRTPAGARAHDATPVVTGGARPTSPASHEDATAQAATRSPQEVAPGANSAARIAVAAPTDRNPLQAMRSPARHFPDRALRVTSTEAGHPAALASQQAPDVESKPLDAHAHGNDGQRLAQADIPASEPAGPIDSPAGAPGESLAALQSESRRLEALVASARDDRMAGAAATVLAASLGERIGVIDTALSQPQLDPRTQLDLWQQRVTALQALAGLEGTRRWLAVHGQSFDGALTRVD